MAYVLVGNALFYCFASIYGIYSVIRLFSLLKQSQKSRSVFNDMVELDFQNSFGGGFFFPKQSSKSRSVL